MRLYLVIILMAISYAAQAQSIDGLQIGQDQSVLKNYPNLKRQHSNTTPAIIAEQHSETASNYQERQVEVFSDFDTTVTIDKKTGKIVQILKENDPYKTNNIFSNFVWEWTRTKDISIKDISMQGKAPFISYNGDDIALTCCLLTARPHNFLTFQVANKDKMPSNVLISFVMAYRGYRIKEPISKIGNNNIVRPSAIYNVKSDFNFANNYTLHAIVLTDLDYIGKTNKNKNLQNLPLIDWQEPRANPKATFSKLKAKDFPITEFYNGPKKPINFSGENRKFKNYRTELTNSFAKTQKPIFAGKYSFGFHYNGPSNHQLYLYDFQSGKIDTFPLDVHHQDLQLIMRQDSSLLLARWEENNSCKRQYFSYSHEKWQTESPIENEGPAWQCAFFGDN